MISLENLRAFVARRTAEHKKMTRILKRISGGEQNRLVRIFDEHGRLVSEFFQKSGILEKN